MNNLTKLMMITAVMFAANLFTSCSSDDDAPVEPSIVGEWLQTGETDETIIDGVSQGEEQQTVDEDNFLRYTFEADGTYIEFYSYEYQGAVEKETWTGTYSLMDNKIVFDGDDDPYEFTLSANELILVFSETNVATNTEYVSTYIFTRQ